MWETVKLKEVCSVFTDGDWIETKDQSTEGIRLVQTGNVKTGSFADRKDKARYISDETFKRLSCTEVMEGDILVSRLPEPVGRSCIIPELQEKAITAVDCTVIRTKEDVLPTYLNYYMQSPQYFSLVQEKVTGATRQRISRKNLGDVAVNLPPLAEQQRIVAKLDAAFAEIDRAVGLCQQKIVNAESIYSNKLTKIFEEKGDDWVCCPLKGITSKIGSGATPRGGKAAYKEDGLSLIRSMNVYDMDFSWKELAKIDDEQAQKLSNVELELDDVLLNITGASVARCTIVPTEALPARVNQHVAIIRTDKSRLTPKLLAYGLVARINKETLLGVGNNAGATRQAITKRDIEEFVFSFPPGLDAQKTLIDVISSIKNEAQKLAELYRKKQENLIALKSAILTQELQPPQSEAA